MVDQPEEKTVFSKIVHARVVARDLTFALGRVLSRYRSCDRLSEDFREVCKLTIQLQEHLDEIQKAKEEDDETCA